MFRQSSVQERISGNVGSLRIGGEDIRRSLYGECGGNRRLCLFLALIVMACDYPRIEWFSKMDAK